MMVVIILAKSGGRRCCSIASEFGDGLFRAVVVYQRFASGGGRNQCRGGGVVEQPG
jgi:hypothetical protein